jgi:hypothetical protein
MFNLHVQCGDKGWIRIGIEINCRILIRIETNGDPKHWF